MPDPARQRGVVGAVKVKIIGLLVVLGAAMSIVVGVALSVADGNWLVGVAVGGVAAVVARFVFGFWLSRQTNRSEVVETEHGVVGVVDAIEVFWRPG